MAQDRRVTGKVTSSSDGSPLPGVSITLKGSTRGTQTDAIGQYSILVPSSESVLTFSFVGFKTESVVVGVKNKLNISLEDDSQSLNEVVVVGYGTVQKSSLTGNIAKVSSKDIQNVPVNSIEQSIQGKAAGVFIEAGNGKLGQGIKMRIRGSSSVTAGNQPLYVVDGIPIITDSQSNTSSPTNPLADINFNDVESVEVLKDASAAAIYGARASNGVVLITTKQGKVGKTNFELNYYTGISNATGHRDWLNTAEYVELFKEARANAGLSLSGGESRFTRYAVGERERWENPASPKYTSTNWEDQVLVQGDVKQLDLNVRGGNDKTIFYASGGYNKTNGILIKNSFERISGRLNLEHKATEKISLGVNFSLAKTTNNRLSNDNAFSTPMQIVALAPLSPVIDPRTGIPTDTYDGANVTQYYNPLINVDYSSNVTTVYRSIGNVFGKYKILDGLSFRTEYGYDLLIQNEETYYGTETKRNNSTSPNGVGDNRFVQIFNYNTNNFFNYNKTFAEKHAVDATLGMSYQESKRDVTYVEGKAFPSSSYKQIIAAAQKTDGTSEETAFAFLSYFARVNYKLDNRYLLSLSGRVDGSSRFGANSRYGFFPAASAGWVVSEENFMKDQHTLSFLKLRASYGLTGNAEIQNFKSAALFSGDAGYAGVPGQRPSQIANPDLKWETTAQADLGIEFGLLKDRISGEIDVYSKNTTDLLLNVNVPGTTGFKTQLRNTGKLENKGFEFVLNTRNIVGAFNWTTSFNIATNKNKITDLQGQVISGSFLSRAVEGQSIGVFYGPEYAGVDPKNGDALYYKNTEVKDANGNVTGRDRSTTNDINDASYVVIGNPNPKWIGGITNTMNYKGIDLSFSFQGVFGNDIYNGGGKFMSANGDYWDNQTKDQLTRWRKPGDITNVPQARFDSQNGTAESSRYVSDGSYVRLKNVTIGYTLPASIIKKLNLSKVRIYATGQNVFTFTKYKGWDPEVNSDAYSTNVTQGIDFYSAPQAKTFILGVNIGF